jgi:hypothetical protein
MQSLRDEKEGIESEALVGLTTEELGELGVAKLGHRKKILAAIDRLREGGAPGTGSSRPPASGPDDVFSGLVKGVPHVVAMPLREYVQEDHPSMRLWAACDVAELLLRFLVTVGLADRRRHGELDDKILKQLWGKIEMPPWERGCRWLSPSPRRRARGPFWLRRSTTTSPKP